MRSALDGHALLIGINDYRGGITPLQSAASDAEAVSAMLIADHGYQSRCLVDVEANTAAILQALDDASRALQEDSGFLLYFAGHGVAIGDGDQGPQGYLLAHDALPTDENSWLSMDVLRRALEQLPCRHVLVVLDCCFAGSFRWSSSRDAVLSSHPLYDSQLARFLGGQAWLALTSSAHDQRAADTLPGRRNTRDGLSGGEHSPFALAFMRGLSGAADSARAHRDPDGVITATELYQYLFDELMPEGVSSRQTPGLWPLRPSNVGEYVFLNPSAALNTRPDPPLDDSNNPWLGLRAYEAVDTGLFFGRRRVVNALIARAADPAASLLVVVGASGTGKSSVVKAGLLPTLAQPRVAPGSAENAANWQIVQVPRLRADPTVQLASALSELAAGDKCGRQLLLIDQFEELYTRCRSAELRTQFLRTLREQVDRPDGPLVVLTLRSDFEPRLAACDQFAALLPAARFLVPAFSSEEMREIVEAPLAAKALYFDPPELVDRLLDEVAAMPGALPLLSFALAEMYRHAQRRRRQTGSADRALTEEDYLATGGVVGALHRRASALHDEVDADLQLTIKRVFLRMVLQEGARTARRRVNQIELQYPDAAEQARVDRVLASYVEARLLVVDQQFIEPAHDTLVVAWDMLQEWLAASPEQPLLRAMWRDTRDWDAASRPAGLLWNDDPRLPQAAVLRPELNTLERRFVRSSIRRKRHRRWTLEAIGLLVMLALGFAALYSMERADEAIKQSRIAERQLEKAQRSAGRANLALADASLVNNDPFAALMGAAEAIGYRHFGVVERDAGPDGEIELPPMLLHRGDSLYTRAITLMTEANLLAPKSVAWRPLQRAAAGADGRVIAGGDGDGGIEVRDFNAGIVVSLDAPREELRALAVSPDGFRIAAVFVQGDGSQRVALWRAPGDWRQAEVEPLELPLRDEIRSLHFDPAGDRLAAATGTDIVLWDISPTPPASARWISRSSAPSTIRRQTSLAFSADGSALLSGGWQNRLTRYPLPAAQAQSSASDDGALRIQGAALGPEWTRWSDNSEKGNFVNAIAVSPGGDFVALASADEILLGAMDGETLDFSAAKVYRASAQIFTLALSDDGRLLAFNDGDVVRLLHFPSLAGAGVIKPQSFATGQLASLSFLDQGRLLLLGGTDKLELVDLSALAEKTSDEALAQALEALPPAGQQQTLREMIESGQLDPLALAYPDSEFPPGGVQWALQEDNRGDGLGVRLFEVQADGEEIERGIMEIRLAPGSAQQVAVGISEYDNIQLRGGRWALLDLFNIHDQTLVFRQVLSSGHFAFSRMRFSDDGEYLLVRTIDVGGEIETNLSFPTRQPDLTLYLRPRMCQSPVNLLSTHWLRASNLLDCGTADWRWAPPAPDASSALLRRSSRMMVSAPTSHSPRSATSAAQADPHSASRSQSSIADRH